VKVHARGITLWAGNCLQSHSGSDGEAKARQEKTLPKPPSQRLQLDSSYLAPGLPWGFAETG
jgi:hypothetical protein